MIARNVAGVVFAAAMALVSVPGQAQTVDEEAAKALFKRNDCAKCHHATREKKGAALAKVAEKYKGKADGPDKLFKHLTSSPKVKMLDDGKEEEHKIIDTKDEKQIRNLIAWILSTK
jgi:cytochrome c